MAVINILDKETAELIAAGEVVERPASVVKELVENSIDAGATKILVDIERGGIRKITVQDNGSGIESEFVRTAFIRHATSKISTKQDLDSINSLGFRGEALPSIRSVSHVTLTTKTEDQDFAIEMVMSGGEEESFDIKPFVNGTRFVIRDLFYNTPARMKFLKKDTTEAGYVQDVVTNLALSEPGIAFTFVKDGKEIFSTIGDGNLLNTIASLFTTEFSQTLTEVDYSDGKYNVRGYTTYPHASRQSRNMQYCFINQRYVKNKTVIAAVENAYKGTVMTGKFPGYVLEIDMPYEAVDVNVHPAKTEVRFENDTEVFGVVYRAVKSAITEDISLKKLSFKAQTTFDVADEDVKQINLTDKTEYNYSKSFTNNGEPSRKYEYFTSLIKIDNTEEDYFKKYITPQIIDNSQENVLHSEPVFEYKTKQTTTDYANQPAETVSHFNESTVTESPIENSFYNDDIKVIGEIFSTYILCQSDNDFIIIDKHAAHERLIYERLKSCTDAGKQMLLIPATVRLSAEEKSAVMENISLLEKTGFDIEEFGENGVIVRAIPMYITSEDPQDLILEIAYNLSNKNVNEISEKLDWIFHSVACRSAIKAGDKAEITRLTRLVYDIRNNRIPLYCPHGRPVLMTMSRKELEKQFGR